MAARKVAFANVPVERLLQALTFDFDTGIVTWREPGPKRRVGQEAGWVCKGYRQITLDYQTMLTQRAIWAVYHGKWPDGIIDHRDGNPLNNRIKNLRPATPVESSINRKTQSNNTSGFKGVYFHKQNQRWQARITIGRKTRSLGLFDTPEEASAAYQSASITVHGDFART